MEIVTLGAATVDRYYHVRELPAADGGSFARDVTERFGGVAANVAHGCDRLGHDAGILTRLGEGEIGERVWADLRDGPLETTRVQRGPERSTHCVILSDESGRRSIVTAGESARALRLTDADRTYLSEADAVFVTAYAPEAVHERLLAWAETPEFPPVAFDLSGPRPELDDRGASAASVERWIDRAALFVVGRVAADSHFDCAGRVAARHLRDRGVARAAVTDGPDGAWLVPASAEVTRDDETEGSETDDETDEGKTAGGESVRELVGVPAVAADVTDETGAGDAYVAGLLHAWLAEGWSAREAGSFAAAAAACNCEATGARAGLATVPTVERAVAERERIGSPRVE